MLQFKHQVDVTLNVDIDSNAFLEAVWKTDVLSQWQVAHILMSAIKPSELRRMIEGFGKENVQEQVIDKLTEFTDRVRKALAESDPDPSKRISQSITQD